MDPLQSAIRLLADARRLVVLTGAGVSTESGIPDFRSEGGVWTRFDPSDFAYERFLDDPAGFWRLRGRLMEALDLDHAQPNAAHRAIARASAHPRFLGHVTQNIDGLFQAAGHVEDKLVEAHGSARTVRCIRCGEWFPHALAQDAIATGRLPPPCPACGGPLKPGTVLFGETLREDTLRLARSWARRADLMLAVGTGLEVHPVAHLPLATLEAGGRLVLVNPSPCALDDEADARVRGKAAQTLPALFEAAGFP